MKTSSLVATLLTATVLQIGMANAREWDPDLSLPWVIPFTGKTVEINSAPVSYDPGTVITVTPFTRPDSMAYTPQPLPDRPQVENPIGTQPDGEHGIVDVSVPIGTIAPAAPQPPPANMPIVPIPTPEPATGVPGFPEGLDVPSDPIEVPVDTPADPATSAPGSGSCAGTLGEPIMCKAVF